MRRRLIGTAVFFLLLALTQTREPSTWDARAAREGYLTHLEEARTWNAY